MKLNPLRPRLSYKRAECALSRSKETVGHRMALFLSLLKENLAINLLCSSPYRRMVPLNITAAADQCALVSQLVVEIVNSWSAANVSHRTLNLKELLVSLSEDASRNSLGLSLLCLECSFWSHKKTYIASVLAKRALYEIFGWFKDYLYRASYTRLSVNTHINHIDKLTKSCSLRSRSAAIHISFVAIILALSVTNATGFFCLA